MLKKTKKVFDKIVLGTGFCHSPDKNSETFKATVKVKENKGNISGVCQHSCHPYLNQATKTSLALTRLDRRTGLRAVG